MVADRSLYGFVDESYWLDAGTPPSYLQANTDVLDRTRRVSYPGELVQGSLVDPTATVDASASVECSVLASRVSVRSGATVRGSVVLEGAVIGEGATVIDSIVGPDASIGTGATLVGNCLVGQGASVPDRARLDGAPVAS